jgi:hypothetical protein
MLHRARIRLGRGSVMSMPRLALVAVVVTTFQALVAPTLVHAQDTCLDDDKRFRVGGNLFGDRFRLSGPMSGGPPDESGSGMTPVTPPKADGTGSGASGQETFTLDPDMFRPPWETRPWGAGVDTVDPERFRADLERATGGADGPKSEGTTAEGGGGATSGGTSGATGLPRDTSVDVLNKLRIRAWVRAWQGLKAHAEALRGFRDPNLKRLGDALKRQADALGDNPPAPLPEPSRSSAPTPLGFRGELKSETLGAGPGPGAMAALVFNPADASLLSSLALGLEAVPGAAPAPDFRQAMAAQATLLQASSDPAEARLGRALTFNVASPGDRPATPAAAAAITAPGQAPSDGEAKPVEDWSYAAWFLWLGLGVDPDPGWQGVPVDPPRLEPQRIEETSPADPVLKYADTAPDPSPPDPRLAVWEAMRKTADSWEQHSDPNIRRLAPWLRWQAELLWGEGDATTAPPPVSRVDARTGGFDFTVSAGPGSVTPYDDDDGDDPILWPLVFLLSRLHVEAGAQDDFWPLVPYTSSLQQLAAEARGDAGPAQILLEARILEPPGTLRSLDWWTSRPAWESAVRQLPAERSEGFDTSSLSPFTLSNVKLLSSTLASPRCQQALCTKPDCTRSEPDHLRNVAPAPGLGPADWPAGGPQPLTIDLDDAGR